MPDVARSPIQLKKQDNKRSRRGGGAEGGWGVGVRNSLPTMIFKYKADKYKFFVTFKFFEP